MIAGDDLRIARRATPGSARMIAANARLTATPETNVHAGLKTVRPAPEHRHPPRLVRKVLHLTLRRFLAFL
jgi:hypothetical protein